MSQFMRYTCKAEALPVVKAALIAKGYTFADPPRAQTWWCDGGGFAAWYDRCVASAAAE
jgi:hypothetical protein